jgi:molybdate/tungstate transport system substrate-binding protein
MRSTVAASNRHPSRRHPSRRQLLVGFGTLTLLAAGCGSSTKAAAPATTAGTTAPPSATTVAPTATTVPTRHSGTVDVLYAGSLVDLMQKAIQPDFHTATGYSVNAFSAGSTDLASDISGKVKQGDVFVSASPTADQSLQGAKGGNFVSWYATFATSKLAIGYNPKSKFAAALKTRPWYDVVTEPGFKLGLTPPASDPKGVLAVKALDETAKSKNLPALKRLGTIGSEQFPETSLEGEVESGQLDAGFFYLAEADSAGIPTVPLTGVDLSATYTVTVLKGAPHVPAGDAFVEYLLGSGGQASMSKYGFKIVQPPVLVGHAPAALKSVLSPGA